MKGWRKLAIALLGLALQSGAFLLLWHRGLITDTIFGIWMGGLLTIITAFLGANVRSKKWHVAEMKNGGMAWETKDDGSE